MDELYKKNTEGILYFFHKILDSLKDENETRRFKKYKSDFFLQLRREENYYTNPEFNRYLSMALNNQKVRIVDMSNDSFGTGPELVRCLRQSEILSYDYLCTLCDFFRLAEKCLYFNNDIKTGLIYIDSSYQPKDREYKFAIDNMYYTIYAKLYTRKDEINNISFKVKAFRIVHKNGKKLTNEITIVNEEFRSKDYSDISMVNSIYNDIIECIYSSYRKVLENIKRRREDKLHSIYGACIRIDYFDTDITKFEN